MKQSFDDSHFDGNFTQLNADLVWDESRRQTVKDNIDKAIFTKREKGRTKELVIYFSSIAAVMMILLIGAAQFLPVKEAGKSASHGQEKVGQVGEIKEIDGVRSLVFTSEATIPLNLVGIVPTIKGEALNYSFCHDPDSSYVWYPTADGQISMHAIKNETGKVNSLQTVPPLREELLISNHQAVISKPDRDDPELFIATKNYDYYISGAKKDVLVEFAKQIKFSE